MPALEQKLYEIMSQKLQQMEQGLPVATEYSRINILNHMWNERLGEIPGLTRMSKMMSLILAKSENQVWVKDPLVISGNEGQISLPVDTAMKIVALGYMP